jgi:hypothetical protein
VTEKRGESVYDDPKAATLPYSVNSLEPATGKRGESVYDNPKAATLPYGVKSLNI